MHTIGVCQQGIQRRACGCWAVPDEVVGTATTAGVVAGSGHWVANDLLAHRQTKTKRLEHGVQGQVGQHRFFAHTAPSHIARIHLLNLRRKLLTHRRANAVTGYHQVGFKRDALFTIEGMHHHTVGQMLHTLHRHALQVALGWHQAVQQVVETAPRGEHLGHVNCNAHRPIVVERHAPINRHTQRFAIVQTRTL